MDIIELLTKDHREVNQLFGRFKRASKPETLEELAKQVIHELSVHSAVEEQFVYPTLRSKLENGSEMADHAIDEHQEVERLLADLEKDDPSSASFSRTMDKVIASVREHVTEEESEILPALREVTDAQFRNRLGEVVERAKSLVPTHPHPMVPGTATAQLVAGPWASLIDRVRDVVS